MDSTARKARVLSCLEVVFNYFLLYSVLPAFVALYLISRISVYESRVANCMNVLRERFARRMLSCAVVFGVNLRLRHHECLKETQW